MTYRELLEFLQSLPDTDDRLNDHVTVYDASIGEFFGQVELMEVIDAGELHENHLYFAWEA